MSRCFACGQETDDGQHFRCTAAECGATHPWYPSIVCRQSKHNHIQVTPPDGYTGPPVLWHTNAVHAWSDPQPWARGV